jgi:hypothetical protein
MFINTEINNKMPPSPIAPYDLKIDLSSFPTKISDVNVIKSVLSIKNPKAILEYLFSSQTQ